MKDWMFPIQEDVLMIELNDKNFEQELKNRKIILVDFYATWCGPCAIQSQVLDKLTTSRNLTFDIAKVNVDESPKLAEQYGVESIPTLMIFKDNKLVRKQVGLTDEHEILKMIEDIEE